MKGLKKFIDRAGFIAIEMLCIAGLMIGLGATAMSNLYEAGINTLDVAVDRVNSVTIVNITDTDNP